MILLKFINGRLLKQLVFVQVDEQINCLQLRMKNDDFKFATKMKQSKQYNNVL